MLTTTAPGGERLYEAVSDLVRAYQFRDRERICCHDINVNQWAALSFIFRHGPVGLGSLAEHLVLDKSTASRVVDSLVKKGLVERVESQDDRRAIRLGMSAAGTKLYENIRASLVADEERMLEGLSPDMRRAALALIMRLTEAARRPSPPAVGSCAPAASCGPTGACAAPAQPTRTRQRKAA